MKKFNNNFLKSKHEVNLREFLKNLLKSNNNNNNSCSSNKYKICSKMIHNKKLIKILMKILTKLIM